MPEHAGLSELLNSAEGLGYPPAALLSIASALETRLRETSANKLAEIAEELGRDPLTLLAPIREAADPQARLQAARLLAATAGGCACSGEAPPEPSFEQEEQAAETLARRSLAAPVWLAKAGLL